MQRQDFFSRSRIRLQCIGYLYTLLEMGLRPAFLRPRPGDCPSRPRLKPISK